jgi:WhiB family redox-sensing transcriptional regulator
MWQDKAACNGMDSSVFLSGVASRIAIAKAVCATCPVIDDCLRFAIDNEDFEPHVYGGMTGAERKRVALAVAS